ncbi:hypothetical protein Syun_020730 [Stephania yunnanensis]|uniref:MYND-type domain-containing protein n=1 Tax=Stephania yunnanensis TaxID=152371 RepID=A0AAP0NP55_9MAGN
MMECGARGSSRMLCSGPAIRRCGRCGVVAYCSISHQVAHWSYHKEECGRLEKQMMNAHLLHHFPFPFSMEATLQVLEKKVTRCSFLMQRNLHLLGMWKHECNCGASVSSADYLRVNDEWGLQSLLCPCQEVPKPMSVCLNNWRSYYDWRCIPLNSPVAVLLHWPLTIYHSIQLAASINLLPEISNKLLIHYLGPDKELCQLSVFKELHALFPDLKLHIELIGPAVPQFRNGERMTLTGYAKCLEIDCYCKSRAENGGRYPFDKSSGVSLGFHKGFYHDLFKDVLKESFPHVIIAPNAGIAAYSSWLPTIELIKDMNVPTIITDYCEEAAYLAASCITTVTSHPLSIPVQLNPFRQPLVMEDTALYLPCYSNCFIFGI